MTLINKFDTLSSLLEINRLGVVNFPGALLKYAAELDLTTEDIGFLTILFYAFQQAAPLADVGISSGKILSTCSFLSSQKLSSCLNRLEKAGLLQLEGKEQKLSNRNIRLECLWMRLCELINRDHPLLAATANSQNQDEQNLLTRYEHEIQTLKEALAAKSYTAPLETSSSPFTKVANVIAAKQGNLLSGKMQEKLKIWLDDWHLAPEFLVMVIEMSFENRITTPQELSYVISELKDTGISSLEGVQLFLKHYTQKKTGRPPVTREITYEMLELGKFTGIDMNAEARQNIYYKWRFDWSFPHDLIMKAGELMSQRTQRGGLEYMDSILNNWRQKNIFTLDSVNKELAAFKSQQRQALNVKGASKAATYNEFDYGNIYIPKDELQKLKNND